MTTDEKIDQILKLCEQHGRDIERINRGLYGDPDNKTPGLIERQFEDESRLNALEERNDRQKWWTGGAVAALTLIFSLMWNWVKELFK